MPTDVSPADAGDTHAPLQAIAREARITRLAELTGLDCLGFPVWQAVRPLSRALSVHQGKGLTDAAARRGAVMEAIESHHAEQWCGPSWRSSWSGLPAVLRPLRADDFAEARNGADPDDPIDWVLADTIGRSAPFAVPAASISLDCVPPFPPGIAISSNGLAAHFDAESATTAALLELVERDAVCEWLAQPPVARAGTEIAVTSVADPAVVEMAGRLAACAIGIRLFHLPAIVAIPVFVAELTSFGARHNLHMDVWGSAAAFAPAEAIRNAVLEAIQTRCTEIAGARDTIPLHIATAAGRRPPEPFALPVRPGWPGHACPRRSDGPSDLATLVEAISQAGYDQIGRVIVSPPTSPATTVRALVPGLGNETRRRAPRS